MVLLDSHRRVTPSDPRLAPDLAVIFDHEILFRAAPPGFPVGTAAAVEMSPLEVREPCSSGPSGGNEELTYVASGARANTLDTSGVSRVRGRREGRRSADASVDKRTGIWLNRAVAASLDLLVLPDVHAWRAWLDAHEHEPDGVWVALAKKGVVSPTSLRYDEALEEALCSGWIDGSIRGVDAAVFAQRFTPRRRASLWSERNVGIVARLVEEGRMRPQGLAEVERAKADGRWERAYAGSASAEVPADLAAALDASASAAARFAELNRQNRYAVIHRIITAPSPTSRANRLAKLVALLESGGSPYPQ
jgi:uncharacterized protein YdeI (YjbR/CyaY-like superfamily)